MRQVQKPMPFQRTRNTSVQRPPSTPGTFDKEMVPRMTEEGMTMMGVKVMRMSRVEMAKQEAPHNKGITWEKFAEHRGYACPGFEPKHPKEGEAVPGEPRPLPHCPPQRA